MQRAICRDYGERLFGNTMSIGLKQAKLQKDIVTAA